MYKSISIDMCIISSSRFIFFCISLQQIHDVQFFYHALPSVVGYRHVQGILQSDEFPDCLQVAVDFMECGAMLSPLVLFVFGGYYREEVWSVGSSVSINYLLMQVTPLDCFLLACCFRCVCQVSVLYVVFCQVENLVGGHSLCVDREKEDVTGEVYRGVHLAKVELFQAFHLFKCQTCLMPFYMITYVNPLERTSFLCQSFLNCQLVDPFQVSDVKGDGVAPQVPVFKPSAVVPNEQRIKILEWYLVFSEVCDEPSDVCVELVGRIISSIVLHLYNERAGVCDETCLFSFCHLKRRCLCRLFHLSFYLLFSRGVWLW